MKLKLLSLYGKTRRVFSRVKFESVNVYRVVAVALIFEGAHYAGRPEVTVGDTFTVSADWQQLTGLALSVFAIVVLHTWLKQVREDKETLKEVNNA